ncbi:MAG: DUF3611 family protein [Methylacidiphilales bacterium]|nr:DUF3611 family protein [Candidatus Methylacidiphilales bacterium]
MQTTSDTQIDPKIERIARILRLVAWISFWIELGFAIASGITLMFAITGRNFNRSLTPVPVPGLGGVNYSQGTTQGIGIGIFWAVCGILALLFSVYLAFRQVRYAKRLRNSSPSVHPKKAEILQLIRLGIIVSLVGTLLNILGGGATLGVLLAKAIAQPQGVAIYDPNRIIRALDIFVALANMNGITGNFAGIVAGLGLWHWLHKE